MTLQEDWDLCLLNGFYNYPDTSTHYLFLTFCANHGIDEKQGKELKRVPQNFNHGMVPVLRFTCAYLPKIADILWKHKPEEIEALAQLMSKSSYTTQEDMADHAQFRQDVNQIKSSMRSLDTAMKKKAALKDRFSSYSRNKTWSITK